MIFSNHFGVCRMDGPYMGILHQSSWRNAKVRWCFPPFLLFVGRRMVEKFKRWMRLKIIKGMDFNNSKTWKICEF